MGTFNDKMTGLADVFRSKFSTNDTLTIDAMSQLLFNADIGEGGGGGVDVSGVTATPAEVLNTVKFVDNLGRLLDGEIETVTPQVTDNIFSVAKGYISDNVTLEVAEAAAPTVSGNQVTLHKGYNPQEQVITVEGGADIPDGYADVSGVTATPNDVLMTARFVDSNGELQEGTIQPVTAYLNDNVFEVEEGYIQNTTLAVPEAATPTVSGNQVTVYKGYNRTEQTITVDNSGGDSTTREFGYWTEDGKFQALDLSGAAPVNSGEPIDLTGAEIYLYATGQNEPDYSQITTAEASDIAIGKSAVLHGVLTTGTMPNATATVSGNKVTISYGKISAQVITVEVPESGGGNVSIYRCTEYDNGEAIPAYSNFLINDLEAHGANGLYQLENRNLTNSDRCWTFERYKVGYDNIARYWCLYDTLNVYMPWADLAIAKAPCLYTTNEGTQANKIDWYTATADDENHNTSLVYNSKTQQPSEGQYGFYFWFMLKLKAGVEYTLGIIKGGTLQGRVCYVYNTEHEEMFRCTADKTINGVELDYGNTYTPTADEIVYIKAGNHSYQYYGGTFQLYCYPAPEVIDDLNLEPWQCTWTPNITMTAVPVAERSATGVQVWKGYRGTQNEETKEWSFDNSIKSGMAVQGITPQVGKIYTEDTSLQVGNLHTAVPTGGKMVALFHFDKKQNVFVDSTETCMMTADGQWYVNEGYAKFGTGSWFYNYMDVNSWMGGKIQGLPELDAFTVEFWHWYDGYYDKFGGPLLIVANDNSNNYGVDWLSGINYQPGNKFYIKQRYFHHALVRDAGSDKVVEYIDGVPAAVYTFAPKFGGRDVWVCAGGAEPGNSGNIGNRMDELAIFNYAKYHGQFEPPTEPYPNIISGLGRPKGSPREVTVSGITGIPFANDPGYALKNAGSTGTSRQWGTEDGQWYIYFDWDSNYCWTIANKTSTWEDGYICAARLVTSDDVDQSMNDFEPIGHDGWTDNITNKKISVTAN